MYLLITHILLGFLLLGTLTQVTFAEPPTEPLNREGNPQTYEDLEHLIASDCDSPEKKWMKTSEGGSLSVPPKYPELNATKINAYIRSAIARDKSGNLAEELSPERIADFSGFKTLELARLEYRNAMNDLFACAIIDSRILILKDLQKRIRAKYPSPNSEIQIRLDTEAKRLLAYRSSKTTSCTAPKTSVIPIETQIKNTATRQYCHFSHYLGYLQDNLAKDNARIMDIERHIGGETKSMEQTTGEWLDTFQSRGDQLANEIAQAQDTLPRAMRTFQEMKRTYSMHVMLSVIHEDYLRLRENLDRYLNGNSQLFIKMDNAQDVNER